jgi:hypothetical protein
MEDGRVKMEVLSCTRFRWKIEDGRWKRLAALESDGRGKQRRIP